MSRTSNGYLTLSFNEIDLILNIGFTASRMCGDTHKAANAGLKNHADVSIGFIGGMGKNFSRNDTVRALI